MDEINATDWQALEEFADRIGFPAARVTRHSRRWGDGQARPGSPYTLLVGRPEAGIESLVGRWFSPQAAEALKLAGGRPLVIGPEPDAVAAGLGGCPTWRSSGPLSGHLLALRTPRAPGDDLTSQLVALGLIDQLVLVTALFQAMHHDELAIVGSLASLAATARVLLVWRPGEEPTEADLAEVPAAASWEMRKQGFEADRFLGAGVWYAGTSPPAGATVSDPSAFAGRPDRDRSRPRGDGPAGRPRPSRRNSNAPPQDRPRDTPAADPAGGPRPARLRIRHLPRRPRRRGPALGRGPRGRRCAVGSRLHDQGDPRLVGVPQRRRGLDAPRRHPQARHERPSDGRNEQGGRVPRLRPPTGGPDGSPSPPATSPRWTIEAKRVAVALAGGLIVGALTAQVPNVSPSAHAVYDLAGLGLGRRFWATASGPSSSPSPSRRPRRDLHENRRAREGPRA